MKSASIFAIVILVAFAAGVLVAPRLNDLAPDDTAKSEQSSPEKKVLYWVAPMDPNFKRDKPGKSPMGMDLVPVYEDQAADGDAVTISPAVENNLGVRTEKAIVRPLWRRIEATGYVGFDETHISHINTRVSGWVISLKVDSEGESVSRGDLLFEFYSPELVNAQKEYLQALRRGGEKLRAGAEDKLAALGMIPSEIRLLEKRGTASENIKIVAPQDGVVTSLGVREGMYVQPNSPIMSLADLSTVWLQAEVFESQADWVAAGQAAEATLDYLPGTVFTGQVEFVYPVLDPVTRTLKVRLRFENPEERLKPNMYARVSIYGRLRPSALSIPREALIPAPGNDRVVVAMGDGKFHVQEVLTGLESGEFVEILAGISEGDEIVVSSQFLIDSEASIAGSIRRLESADRLPEQREMGAVFASGRVDEIDMAEKRIRVSHGPIDELAWPSMTMVFDVRPAVDLGQVKVGQDIRFALVQGQAGEYVMEQIFTGEKGAAESTGRQSGQPNEAEATSKSRSPSQAALRRITASAIVRGIDREGLVLNLQHEPITELKWPAMTMNFAVEEGAISDELGDGQTIHFSMYEDAEGKWVIDRIHIMKATGDGDDSDD